MVSIDLRRGWRPLLHHRLARLRGLPPVPRLIDRLTGPLDDVTDLLIEQIPSGVLIIDRKGRVLRANAVARLMAGRGADIAVGQPILRLFADEERDTLWGRLQPAMLGRPLPSPLVATLIAHPDSPAPERGLAVEITLQALRETDGAVSGLLLRLTDMTVQKRLEAQLAQSQKLQAVGQLAAGIAHDFNNLLTAVIGGADMIAARPGLDDETREDATQIRLSAERGGNLVRQLLAFGRQQALSPQVISINEAIRDLSGLLGRLLGSNIRLELDLEQPGRMARVDPTQLDQVLVNLAVNARDAMQPGGTLTLRSGHITLHRSLVRGQETIPPGRYVMIEVQDSGSGIAPEVLPRIFDPFFSTKRERGGSGLGLSTVHGIVRQSDGFLGVESELGRGTRLRIYLPRFEADNLVGIPDMPADVAVAVLALPVHVESMPPRSPPPMIMPATAAHNLGRLVLLVDDEAPVRRLAERALSQAGWTVVTADSGESALDLLRQQPDRDLALVISDVMMPGINGPMLVENLRQIWPTLPAILVSGYAHESLREELAQAGSTFLAKPYRLADLVERANTSVGEIVR